MYRGKGLFIVLLMLLTCCFTITTTYADAEPPAEVDIDTTKLEEKFNEIYAIVARVTPAVATVGVALNAIGMLWGQKSMEKSVARIAYIFVAVAIIYLLPNIIKFGASLIPITSDPLMPHS